MQIVLTGQRTYCIVSYIASPAETTPPGSWQVHLFAARIDADDRPDEPGGGTAGTPASLSNSAAYVDSGVLETLVRKSWESGGDACA